MRRRFRPKFLLIIPFVLLGLAVFSAIVMLLWNNVLAAVVHVGLINFWQALGLLILSKILFGSFKGAHWGRHQMRHRLNERWESMTPEQREKFKQELKNRCGHRFGRDFDKGFQEQKTAEQ